MRLSFPNGELGDVFIALGDNPIGSASGNTVVLPSNGGIAPHHAVLTLDRRGLTLSVPSPQAIAHVNARRVKEKAILRVGDLLSLGATNVLIKPDRDEEITSHIPPSKSNAANSGEPSRANAPRVVLRGMAGSTFGKVIPIGQQILIGKDSKCDLVINEAEISNQHARIEAPDAGIWLRSLSNSSPILVNGVEVKEVMLFSGDQITFVQNRFLLEAPGTPARSAISKLSEIPSSKPSAEVTQSMRAINLEPATPKSTRAAPLSEHSNQSETSSGSQDRMTALLLLLTGASISGLLFWLLMR